MDFLEKPEMMSIVSNQEEYEDNVWHYGRLSAISGIFFLYSFL